MTGFEERNDMSTSTIAALQIGSSPEGKGATLEKILGYERGIATSGAKLVVMPEAVLGGYPKGETFGTYLGYRLPEGRESFRRYHENAVELPGPEIAALEGLSARTGAFLVLGVIERAGSSLYCTAIFIDPEQGYVGKHRKLMPTAAERLVWGQGDGSTLTVVDSPAGRVGSAICWENYMPLMRTAMYAKGVEIWCAPTVDEREIWQASMRHIGYEGRCFLVSACQVMGSPVELGVDAPGRDPNAPLINGGSLIVGPLGDVLAGPLQGEEGLLTATIDLDDIPRARYDFDPVGHYARPDVFSLSVDESPRAGVHFT
jgi:nitrilase